MTYFEGEIHKKAFENSHTVIFAFDDDIKLICKKNNPYTLNNFEV